MNVIYFLKKQIKITVKLFQQLKIYFLLPLLFHQIIQLLLMRLLQTFTALNKLSIIILNSLCNYFRIKAFTLYKKHERHYSKLI